MHADHLPVETWKVILGHLRKPIPPPLSRPHRNALRQHDLAVSSGVCKMFRSICTSLLYSHIVTDDFPALFSTGGDLSRRRYLLRTQSLYIEYSEKGSEPSFYSLMEIGGPIWTEYACQLDPERREETIMMEYKVEVFRLMLCFKVLRDSGMHTSFPPLRTMAVASIYGHEDDVWARYDDMCVESGRGSDIDSAIQSWQQALATSRISDLCIRDPGGPISLLPISAPSSADHTFGYTIHFNATTDIMSLFLGRPSRWILEPACTDSWSNIFRNLGANIAKIMIHRQHYSPSMTLPPIELDIYCSTSVLGESSGRYRIDIELKDVAENDSTAGKPLSIDQQRKMCEKLADHCQGLLRDHSGVKDELRLHPSADTPMCKACGSGPPS